MTAITEFYSEKGCDHAGRTLSQILIWDNVQWEQCHDYIQWLFPTREASRFNRHAPVLTDEDVQEFQSRPDLQMRISFAADRFEQFLGLNDDGVTPHWVSRDPNHNYLRITRVISSLRELGPKGRDRQFFDRIEETFLEGENRIIIGDEPMNYWRKAIGFITNG